jgi:lysophospholipase L1-like esterase
VPTLLAYGHSYVDGDGASAPSRCFAALTAEALSYVLRNEAIGGSLSTRTAAQVTADRPSAADRYLLMTGVNDARLYGDLAGALADYGDALAMIFETFTATSPRAQVITVEQPYLLDYTQHSPHDKGSNKLVDKYNDQLRQVAQRCPHVVVTAVEGWDPATMIADDTVHPNDLGHRELAAAVCRVARASGVN